MPNRDDLKEFLIQKGKLEFALKQGNLEEAQNIYETITRKYEQSTGKKFTDTMTEKEKKQIFNLFSINDESECKEEIE